MAAALTLSDGGYISRVKLPFDGSHVLGVSSGATMTIIDCTIPRTATGFGTIVLSGGIEMTGPIVAGGVNGGTLTLNDGTTLRATSTGKSVTTILTLNVGANCAFVTVGGITVSLASGSYTSASITSNGTITEA